MKNSQTFLETLALVSLAALLLSCCVLLHLPGGAEAYSSGAPVSACGDMTPQHGGTQPSAQLSPYVILVSKNTYSPGDTVSVMLRGLCGTQFKGFMAQVRRSDPADPRYAANPEEAIGTFQAVIGSKYQCGGQSALTHDGRYNATTLLFTWTAPAQPQGHVQLKATFVQDYNSIWTSVASVVMQDPSAAPISVDADTLRTDFIEPCEIDRPKPKTTAPPPTPPTTTPTTTTTATTTVTTTATTTRGTTTTATTLPPPPPSPTAGTTVSPTSNGPTTASAQLGSTTTNSAAANVELTTKPTEFFITEEASIKCGETHGCFRQCLTSQICEFRVAWQPEPEGVLFDVMVPPIEDVQDQWLALAFSDDHKMGMDSVVECMTSDNQVETHLSFNDGRGNDILSSVETGAMMSKVAMAQRDGYLHCQFLRKMNMSGVDRVYDLERDWFLLLAQGSVRGGQKERHAGIPVASARLVDLQALEDVGLWVQDKIFIKIHASLMAFAWIFCAGFGIVVARYYKPLWPKHMLCGRKVWFTIHRALMILLGIVTLFGFAIIFVEAKGFAEISAQEFQKMHPVVGMIVTLFTVVQILFGIFRPSSSSKNRPVYNWGHWLLGVICHILAIINIGLGLKLRKSGTHASAAYVLYSYAIYQICMIVALEIISCNIRRIERKTASYVIYESRSTIYSSAKEIMEGEANEPAGSIALRIAIKIHLLFVTAFTAALIALVAIA